MYLISIIAVLGLVAFTCMTGGINIVALLDLPTLILLLFITVPMLVSAGLLKDFNRAFRFVIGKKKADSLKELRRSIEALSLAIKTIQCSGVLISSIEVIVMLRHADRLEMIGPMVCVSILAVVYGIGLSLLLFPIRTQLQLQVIEYLSEEE
ncbi:MAG: hypothetical protein HFI37_06480 [Lachnospiraceae bacterium]|nr:hypothetical protein [Lachnospiraceae bacterium]